MKSLSKKPGLIMGMAHDPAIPVTWRLTSGTCGVTIVPKIIVSVPSKEV